MSIAAGYHHDAHRGSTNVTDSYPPSATPYTGSDSAFVTAIVGAAVLSNLSVVSLLLINYFRPPSHLGDYTHIPVIFGSLLVANFLQSIGTILDAQWVSLGMVSPGTLCSVQGGIKQAGNVGTAVWTFMLALHAFRLLYLRSRVSSRNKWWILGLGWFFVVTVVTIGPLAIQNLKTRGPYFGPAGYWCWITKAYTDEEVCLEYMLEWMSALFSFILYVAVLLRVRGNLIQDAAGKWSLRWVARGDSWRLAFTRDYLDSCTVKMVTIIVWYPVIYTVLIVPISIARFASYAGAQVPVAFTFMADFVFALGGFANLNLFLGTRCRVPNVATIPDLSMPRSRLDKQSPQAAGITPFVLPPKDAEDGPSVMTTASDGEVAMSSERRPIGEPKSRVDSVLSVLFLTGLRNHSACDKIDKM